MFRVKLHVLKLKTEHAALLNKALATQRKWYLELIRIADILWSRTNGNPLAISVMMRDLHVKN